MPVRTISLIATVFFCLMGWVYGVSANGAEGNGEAAPTTAPVGLFDLAAPTPAPAAAPAGDTPGTPDLPEGQKVSVGSFGQIDLHIKDLELTKVLQLLSIQSQRNIIAGKGVSGTVSADLYNVDFYDALRAILQPNGYGFKEQNNCLYVYSADDLKKLTDVDHKTVAKVVRLNYLDATDAATFVSKMLSSGGAITLPPAPPDALQPTLSDNGSNKFANAETLVIVDFPENVEQIMNVLEQLDVRPKQVLIDATVLEVKIDEENGWGVDVSAIADLHVSDFTNPLSEAADALSGTVKGSNQQVSNITSSTNVTKNGSLTAGVVANNASVFVHALEQLTTTHILARPKTLVLNRHRADLLVGTQLAYLSTTNTATASTQTVNYLNTGTELTVRPFVSDDGYIRMELKPSIIVGTLRTIGSGSGSTTVPDASTQSLITSVMVRNGQTVVLGGLFQESTTVSKNQMPGLGDVPVLGAAFQGHDDSMIRSETIFLITPTIVKDDFLGATGQRMSDDLELSRIGAREGLLPWSKSKVTAGYMRQALESVQRGNKDKALWDVDRALTLDPTFVEARRLRETLNGDRGNTTGRSLLDDAVNCAIDQQIKTDKIVPPPPPDHPGGAGVPATQPTAHAAPAAPAPATQPARREGVPGTASLVIPGLRGLSPGRAEPSAPELWSQPPDYLAQWQALLPPDRQAAVVSEQ
jgi:type IV pilus assembly protein PilQ